MRTVDDGKVDLNVGYPFMVFGPKIAAMLTEKFLKNYNYGGEAELMKNSRLLKTPFSALLVILLSVLTLPGTARAGMSDYCQIPTYAYQSVIPSVSFLISNSKSMLQFAHPDDNTANLCTDSTNPCGGFDSTKTYYGYFNSGYWYQYTTPGGGGGFQIQTRKTDTTKQTGDWSGNFLNWLTMRRIDVVRKVITGGEGAGYAACTGGLYKYKKFPVNSMNYTPYDADNVPVTFNDQPQCDGNSLSTFSFNIVTTDTSGHRTTATITLNVQEKGSARSGIYQDYAGKAQMEFFFYNADNQGASTKRGINGTQPPTSLMLSLINTPSNYNGIASAPLGEALWTIVGHYALSSSTSGAGFGDCPSTSNGFCGPKYHSGQNAEYNIGDDPYTYYGSASQCVKGNVIVISDGEPCNDGNLPDGISTFGDNNSAFLTKCTGSSCSDASALGGGIGIPTPTINPACSAGNVAGFERVALFAHTQDLRQSGTFDGKDLGGKQNLDVYVIQAFGSDNSNILKYGAINGSFIDSNKDGFPSLGEFDISERPNSAYFKPDNEAGIKQALDSIFFNILRRATSGTAASVLASGEGSGANLVQAVFYPKRNFSGEVIEWTGTLHNFWYYIDPYFGNSSIREDSDQNGILNLVSDKTLVFRFDPVAQLTVADLYTNDPSTGNPPSNATPTTVSFEEVKSLWEAGKFLHVQTPDARTIFTVTDASPSPNLPKGIDNSVGGTVFTTANKNYFKSYLGVPDTGVDPLINYVRGVDDLVNFRQRTVLYPATPPNDNTVWKLGDIINSTPRVVASIPLNNYNTTYNDFTYKAFTDNSTYKNRGMVFAGANDGMLHAFKLGKLTFPLDNTGVSPGKWNKAKLENINTWTGALGSEQWAFIPKNALPYLQALQDNNYCHLYYVDLAPQVFDASIGGDNTAGNAISKDWRTVLIGGMRFGGACRDYVANVTNVKCSSTNNDNNCVASPVPGGGLSSYFAIDVTNPAAPKVLWEFSDSDLGFATTGPAVVRINAGNPSTNGNWYAVFGSGPTGPITSRQFLGRSDQNLKLFVVDLRTGELLRKIDTFGGSAIPNAFAGSMINSTADFNLDYTDDVLYLGYVQANGGTWNQGGVVRLQTNGSVNPYDWVASKVIDGIGPVTSSVVRLQNNNIPPTNWLYFGTGRYYYFLPNDPDDPTSGTPGYDDPFVQRRLYGIKEPCFGKLGSKMISPSCTDKITDSLTDRSTASSAAITSPGWFINLDANNGNTCSASIAYDNTGAQSYLAERVITDPLATTSGVVFFTTLRPYCGACAVGGRTFLWAVQYDTGGVPPIALQGKAMMQVSTASVEQLDLSTAFSQGDTTLNRGGRRSYSMEGVPPTSQGLSLLVPPPPVKRILHMKER
ncbi:pilus assembly protein [Candidatus Deferrimicrobium sp.]|uniref:pilus assembly protein n=1 Tax=Candidatus Deferrimicrobium sp. TaxID=3060586 RepID=UPI002ED5CBFE